MKNITKEQLVSIVKRLMLEPSNEVIDQILAEWNSIQRSLEFMNKFNTENIKPLTHINENLFVDFLREDIVSETDSITKQQALSNAGDFDNDFIITTKVVR